MNTFFIDYVGCSRRSLDCQRVKNYLVQNGLTQVASPNKAGYLLVFTCGFHKAKEDESIDLVEKCTKNNGELIVCGCLPVMNPDRLKNIFGGRTIATKDMDDIDELFPHFQHKFKSSPDANWLFISTNDEDVGFINKYHKGMCDLPNRIIRKLKYLHIKQDAVPIFEHIVPDKNDYSIRILEGCLGNCSYCSVKNAVGGLRSKPIQTIIDELRKGLSQGFHRVNIVSPDTGGYGKDIGSDIVTLLKMIIAEDEKIIIPYLEDVKPVYLYKYKEGFIDLVKTGRIKSMVVSVESGSKRLLKLMNRSFDLVRLREAIMEIKENSAIRLATRVLVGFPTETDEDFQSTIDYIKALPFEEVDVHYYHETEAMASAMIYPKVDCRIIRDRAETLKEVLSGYMQVNSDPS